MAADRTNRIADTLAQYENEILEDWLREQLAAVTVRRDLLSEAELRRESTEFLGLFAQPVANEDFADILGPAWSAVREFLAGLSRTRATRGFSPSEVATFVFSLKQPLFSRLQKAHGADAASLAEDLWALTTLIDKLGLFTTETYQTSREEVIGRQQIELLELSTPVVKLWDGILALPLIGTLDSSRTQVVMESLLQAIVETGSGIAIIDITGVPAVDTLVAQHLLKTVAAARLMGAECVISGIRPQIAATMVHLGVALGEVATKASLADALSYAFGRLGIGVTRQQA